LISKRAKKPLHHAIYYMLSTLPDELRDKDNEVKEFYEHYKKNYLPGVKDLVEK
jgi:galactose-1-phosphate uridylyltransferase